MNNKVIIDTDPWVDDAIAIMYAIKSWFSIKAITTIFWNTDIENTTINALKILSIMDINIPVYKWLEKAIKVKNTFATSHWLSWFGWYDIDIKNNIEKKDAISYYIDSLETNEDKISIICLWPTTNIAKLLLLRPDLKDKIDKIIVLWWVLNEEWNISPYSEFNVYNDPDALKIILSYNLNIYLIPIDICRKVYFTSDEFDKINNNSISTSIKEITKHYIYYYQNDSIYWNFEWWVMYDLLATVFFTNEELFTYKDAYIDVIIENTPNIGQTLEDYSKNPNCKVIKSVNVEKLKELFFNTMNTNE